MSLLTPTLEEIETIRSQTQPGPVVMVNLLKFKPGGLEHFARYGQTVGPLIQRAGGEVLYSGQAGAGIAGDTDWDLVILVRFEDIDRFAEMVGDPIYQGDARAHREAALERTVWLASTPAS